MARGRLNFLERAEVEHIHAASLEVLEEVGVAVHSESIRQLLIDSGCTSSEDGGRILISEDIVKSALSSAPKSILLASRNRKSDFVIPSYNRTYMADGGTGTYVRNLITGEQRPSSKDDIRDFCILVEKMPQLDFAWYMVAAMDQPANIKGLIEFMTALQFTTKHIQGEALNEPEAKYMVEIASLFTGGAEELRKRPIFSSVQCPISPLTFEKGLVEAQAELARAGVPVVAMSASLAGITSPITISGTIMQSNAENLASLVISQAAEKGAPFIYSSDSSAADLKSGMINYGAFEGPLINAGSGQMGRYYGLPVMVTGASLEEAISRSIGSVEEGLPYMMLSSAAHSDLGSGIGSIDQAAGASYQQFIVDAWVWELSQRFTRDFDVDDDAISFDTIREAAADGTFLNKPHTMKRFKTEFVSVYRGDVKLTGKEIETEPGRLIKKADKEAKKLLSGPKEPLVTRDEMDRMREILERAKQ